jgi:hypothetical protein
MTIKDLKDQLSSMDDSYTLTIQTPDGTQRDITKTSQKGKHFTFMTSSIS